MGFAATQVDGMSLWQFLSQVEGYADAHTPDKDKKNKLSDAQFESLASLMDET
jgi:hypothetical protein